MATKPSPYITAEGCAKHKTYYSRSFAKSAVKRLQKQMGGRPVEPFRCPHCTHWHIGHRPTRSQREAIDAAGEA